MSISKTKRNFLLFLTIFTILIDGVGGVVYYDFFPEHYFGGYPLISVYFYLFGVFNIYMFDACRKYAPKKILLLHLAMKIMKMLFSIMFLAIYCVVVREEARAFLLTFVANYLMFLIFETWFFSTFELNRIRKNKNKNETVA